MPIWRVKPLVFVSSAMGKLGDVRARLHERLATEGLVEDWVFEFHATSGGEPAPAQYLDVARSCDVMALIVGQEHSRPTEEEYEEAARDNPDKVIPVYLGDDAGATREFRKRIDQRHSRTIAADEDGLVERLADGIVRAVREGRLLARPLRERLERRLDELDRLVDIQPPQSFIPLLQMDQVVVTWAGALAAAPQLVVEAVGGAGKTYGALTELHRLTRVLRAPLAERDDERAPSLDGVIPLYLRAIPGLTALEGMIERAFSAVRFFPGPELSAQYARDGRLALVVDGYDDLAARDRSTLLQSVGAWAEANPRCRLVVLARSLDAGALPAFARASAAPLAEEQIVELLPIRGMIDVPPELKDLVVRPFWAAAIARFGTSTRSGLELLQAVVTRRLELATPGEATRAMKLRAALGALALDGHPAIAMTHEDAVATLAAWQETDAARSRFAPEPADALLDSLRGTGLVSADGPALAFVHPLVAVTVAAEVAAGEADVEGDDDLAAFTTALLAEERQDDLVSQLGSRDIFFLARVLRLSYARPRESEFEADVVVYEDALRRLAALVGPEAAAALRDVHIAAAAEPDWTALRHLREEVDRLQPGWDELVRLPGDGETVVWQGNPFASRMPALLAAAELVYRFKELADPLTRTEPSFGDEDGRAVPPTDEAELSAALIDQARLAAAAERELRSSLGLADSRSLPRLDGQPHIYVISGEGGRYLREEWGEAEPQVTSEEADHPVFDDGVARFLAKDAGAVACERLRHSIEKNIGSALQSAAWSRPAALAGWVW